MAEVPRRAFRLSEMADQLGVHPETLRRAAVRGGAGQEAWASVVVYLQRSRRMVECGR